MNWRCLAATLAAIAVQAASQRARAEVYRPWCVGYTATISNSCTFVSFAQCMETARGGGGSCMHNPWYVYYSARAPARAGNGEHKRRR
jgi:hypothetical protein